MTLLTHHLSTVDATSSSTIELHPNFEFDERFITHNAAHRSVGGLRNSYKIAGGQWEFTLAFDNVNSETVASIRHWWNQDAELIYTQTMSVDPQSVICRFTNEREPFFEHVAGRFTAFNGMVTMRSSRNYFTSSLGDPAFGNEDIGDKTASTGFILDDAILGKLDQTYNHLL